jgi:hypothetical protein
MAQILEHDPEKCEAVFRKDHAQEQDQSAMMTYPGSHRALTALSPILKPRSASPASEAAP